MAGELYVGMMSGTSVDGIDAALVEITSRYKLRVLATDYTPFPTELRQEINQLALNNSGLFKNEDSSLHNRLADHYADAANHILEKNSVPRDEVRAIANHGQTVRHEPNANPPFSLQLGDGQLIADQTGITTITQFRQADIAAGGQGAPLMPAFHEAMFGRTEDAYVLNLGGIANITCLGADVVGFDTGPSNCLMDNWIELKQGERFDENGEWAESGTVINEALTILLQDAYLQLDPPKSTGTDYFNLDWLQDKLTRLHDYRPADVQATLLAFTVQSVAHALNQREAEGGNLYVCGGGAQNGFLMQSLAEALTTFRVQKTDVLGVPSDWVEAAGFAWLGYCFLHGEPSNLPSVTGANQQLVLGEQFRPQSAAEQP
ncbi:MAG: anhydro-N-acetylmuramic acid kinase [Pseudomonadota bacterium]